VYTPVGRAHQGIAERDRYLQRLECRRLLQIGDGDGERLRRVCRERILHGWSDRRQPHQVGGVVQGSSMPNRAQTGAQTEKY
jgi:hypothetical protein